ncbi:MAG: 16S rRNA (cytidine(1402)-2'-O)-methyltransferase [Lactobacillus sp.]|nr:16S rRNA (cytidine(1402)-2'-O)-methyltransferase [Lactobacillus sp.]
MQIQKSYADEGGKLYLVPTPLGNLGDITLRAKEILTSADYIACEDTRTSKVMLDRLDIHNQLVAFHKFNSQKKAPELVEKMKNGAVIAEISDAGMPVISDPGYILVEACIKAGIPVIPLPGPSAFVTALVASGFDAQPFTYYGFLSRKASEQKPVFQAMKEAKATSIFYEAPHRLVKTLKVMLEVLGPDRQICAARELTKIHEEFVRGSVQEVLDHFEETAPRGEFVMLVSPNEEETVVDLDDLLVEVDRLVADGESKTRAIKMVAKAHNLSKNELYDRYHQAKE